MIDRGVHQAELRTGQIRIFRKLLRYVFPEHWSFMWGEIALYCFVVLVITGTYLALFFDPSYGTVTYHGSYAPLHGQQMSRAYESSVRLSLDVKAGLLIRQTHHWAADIFVAAITIHLMRVFFTGAFRKPREVIYWTGLTMLIAAVLEGFMGYSLVDDLLSGMGLAIGWSVLMSVPIVGAPLATLVWGGQFPGGSAFESRLFIAHVFLFPALIGLLIAVHLGLIMLLHHTQFRGTREREDNVVGAPMWPAYATRSIGLFLATAGVLFLLGGLVQINPIWLWGPYHAYLGENGAQPDWYVGWLIGALRLMPNWELVIAGKTVIPNPFLGGVLFPTAVFGLLYAYPLIERRVARDDSIHNLLQRPRDNHWRTAFGAGFFTWVAVPFFAGASDRAFLAFGISYQAQVQVMRVAWFTLPLLVFLITLRICRALRRSGAHPLRNVTATQVERTQSGGFHQPP